MGYIMVKQKFMIVNPYIMGKLKNNFVASTPLKAAEQAYKSLSSHFSNSVPIYFFSLQSVENDEQLGGGKQDDYYHFKVQEDKKKNNIDFVIEQIDVKINKKIMKDFSNQINKINKSRQKSMKNKNNMDDPDEYKKEAPF